MTSEDGTPGNAGDEPATELNAGDEPTADPDEGGERVEPGDGEENHLDDVEDGAGCAEIWERLSERRGE